MPEQKINNLNLNYLEVKDNSEQNRGGKFISFLCIGDSEHLFDHKGTAQIFPSAIKFSIRNCEKISNSEYILTVKGLHRKDIKRGNVIIPSFYGVSSGKEAYILLPSSKNYMEKGNYHFLGGIFNQYNERNNKATASVVFHGRVGIVRFFYPFPLVVGGKYFISPESRLDEKTTVTLIYPGSLNQKDGSELSSRILKFGGRPSLRALYSVILRIKHYVQLPSYMEEDVFEGSLKCGPFAIMTREYDRVVRALEKRTSAVGGLVDKKISLDIKGDEILIHAVLEDLVNKGIIQKKDSYYMNISKDMRKSLSPMAKKILNDLEIGNEILNFSNLSNPLLIETYKSLARMGLIKILSDEVIITEIFYNELKQKLLKGLEIGDELLLTEAKESLLLSRRVLIPFLEEMDREEYFKRDGESRIVIKIN